MLARAVVALLLTGCMSEPSSPPIEGTPADVTTPAGNYPGHRVVTACPTGYADIGVIGTGATRLTDTEQISAAGRDLALLLADTPSVWGTGGFGLACEDGIGTSVHLNDWRDVDHVIAVAGRFLGDRDLVLQVGISVESIPVPHNAP